MDAKAEEDPMLPMTTDEIETAPGARLVVVTGDGEAHEVERAELMAAGSVVQLHCPAIAIPTLAEFDTEELEQELRSRGWTVAVADLLAAARNEGRAEGAELAARLNYAVARLRQEVEDLTDLSVNLRFEVAEVKRRAADVTE